VCPGRDVDVLGVDAFLGQQRRQLVQQLVRHAGLNWISGSPAGGGSGVRRRMSGMKVLGMVPLLQLPGVPELASLAHGERV